MQADGRLVQDVGDTDEAAAHLRRKADALALAAGKGPGCPRKAQVIEAHVHEEAESRVYLAEDGRRDRLLVRREAHSCQIFLDLTHGLVRQIVDILAADRDRQGSFLKPHSLTSLARRKSHIIFVFSLEGRAAFAVAPLQVRNQAFELHVVDAGSALALVMHRNGIRKTVKHEALLKDRVEILKRNVHVDMVEVRERLVYRIAETVLLV